MLVAIVATVSMLAIGWLVWRKLQQQEARERDDGERREDG